MPFLLNTVLDILARAITKEKETCYPLYVLRLRDIFIKKRKKPNPPLKQEVINEITKSFELNSNENLKNTYHMSILHKKGERKLMTHTSSIKIEKKKVDKD